MARRRDISGAAARLAAACMVWGIASVPLAANVAALPPLPRLEQKAAAGTRAYASGRALVLENERTRVAFLRDDAGYRAAVWFAHDGKRYAQVGITSPLGDVVSQGPGDKSERLVIVPASGAPSQSQGSAAVAFEWQGADSAGVMWRARLDFRLAAGAARASVVYTLSADRAAKLLRFTGPSLYAGGGSFGADKSFALFAGLEYLMDDERSSSRRDAAEPINLRLVPHPFKVTMPVMAVSHGQYLTAILWDQRQLWDGKNYTLSAEFASPNWHEGRDNHLMRLFLPTVPQWVAENAELAETPYDVEPGTKLRMAAYIAAEHMSQTEPRAVILRALDHYYEALDTPAIPPRPRTIEAEMQLSRFALLNTVWDEETRKHRHCVDWAPTNAPGFATLMWIDYLLTRDARAKQELKERVELVASQTVAEQGEAGLASPANCHILRWEFPFYWGHLAGGLAGAEAQAYGALRAQERDGSWRFEPDEKHRNLGKFGDAVIGTCARRASDLLRYARITGDQQCLAAGLKALGFVERFSIPRGAQAWECPLYEPDILAAGYIVPAYVEAYRLTGDTQLLARASYWAKTGLPFLYAWNRPDTPGMCFASIPVFGTTFYTHSWFGVPVQWNGLVYAYGLQHLAPYDASMPWMHIAEGITVSGTWQQVEEAGKLKGTYCDGWYEHCTDGRGPWINPEDIMVNLFALMGFDPDVSTALLPDPIARRRATPRVHVSSGARVTDARMDRGAISFGLKYSAGETSHTLIAGVNKPTRVAAHGAPVAATPDLAAVAEGWQYDAERNWFILKLTHVRPDVEVRVSATAARR
ncbi:MAG: hypothetical protein JSV65_08420 [Armatimonadota bacterium]|nr:MAG: hypothetical protein JSV65_08420 [Armatimonadota bacterium]